MCELYLNKAVVLNNHFIELVWILILPITERHIEDSLEMIKWLFNMSLNYSWNVAKSS